MGSSCSICHSAPKYNPIIENLNNNGNSLLSPQNFQKIQIKSEATPNSIDMVNSGENLSQTLKLFKAGFSTTNCEFGSFQNLNFTEIDYANYLNLQKLLLTKNQIELKNFSNNNYSYEGQMNGKSEKDGKGILKLSNGTIYFGDWVKNKAEGKGNLLFSNFDRYEGNFVNNQFQGEGIYIENSKLRKFEGLWEKNVPNGFGTEYFAEGHFFEGNYINGKKNGKGSIRFYDGSYFSGFIYLCLLILIL